MGGFLKYTIGVFGLVGLLPFQVAFSNTTQSADIKINENLVVEKSEELILDEPIQKSTYTHVATINVYTTPQHPLSFLKLRKMVNLAQSKLDKCGIQLKVNRIVKLNASNEFSQFETIEFNEGYLTQWEKSFFSKVRPASSGVLFVDSLDWTIGDDGVIAAGYGPFALKFEDFFQGTDSDRKFYLDKMAGHMVIGKAMSKWTFLHEIGHAIMDLDHTYHQRNVMFADWGETKKIDPVFTKSQCAHGRNHYPHVQPVNTALAQAPLDGSSEF